MSCSNPLFATNITFIVRANTSEDAKTRMNENEIISQMRWGFGIPTLIFSLAYVNMDCAHCSTLFLSRIQNDDDFSFMVFAGHTNIQDKLRREINGISRQGEISNSHQTISMS